MRSSPFNPLPGDFILVSNPAEPVTLPIRIGEALNGEGFGRWVTIPTNQPGAPNRRFEGFTHAAMVVPDGRVVEAEPGGARLGWLAPYRDAKAGGSFISSTWDLSDQDRHNLCVAARARLDTPYSFLDYGSLALRRFDIPAPGLRRYIASTKHMICSQLVDQIYLDANLHVFDDGRWPGDVTPMGLFPALTGPVGSKT